MADELSRLPLDFRGSVEEAVVSRYYRGSFCSKMSDDVPVGPNSSSPCMVPRRLSAYHQSSRSVSHVLPRAAVGLPRVGGSVGQSCQLQHLLVALSASGKDQFTEYRATSSFVGQRDGELSFERGDVIFVTRKSSGVDIGRCLSSEDTGLWWTGRNSRGEVNAGLVYIS